MTASMLQVLLPVRGDARFLSAAIDSLRAQGVSVLMQASAKDGLPSLKAQFKRADASGTRHALVFGTDELARGVVTVKALREGGCAEQERHLAELAHWGATLQSAA